MCPSEVYCRALVRSVSQCSLQAVCRLVRESVWSVRRCMGKVWECASAAALSATVLPMTPTSEEIH